MADIKTEFTRENTELVGDDSVALSSHEVILGLIRHPTHATKALGEKFALITVDDVSIDDKGRTLIKNVEFRAEFEKFLNGPSVAANGGCVNIYCPQAMQ